MTVTTVEIAEHIETDLVTSALQRLIDDAVAEIDTRYGSDTTLTEQFQLEAPEGFGGNSASSIGRRRIWTKREIGTITTLKEGPTFLSADLTTLVVTTDYQVIHDGRAIERIGTDFQKRVEVIYAPVSDTDRRDRVTIDLVRLAIQYNALDTEKVGDWSGSSLDYQKERESILSTLNAGRRMFA